MELVLTAAIASMIRAGAIRSRDSTRVDLEESFSLGNSVLQRMILPENAVLNTLALLIEKRCEPRLKSRKILLRQLLAIPR